MNQKCSHCPILGECWAQHHHRPFCDYIRDGVPGRLDQLRWLSVNNSGVDLISTASHSGSADLPLGAVICSVHNNTFTGYGQHATKYAKQLEHLGSLVRINQLDRSEAMSPCDPWIDGRVVASEVVKDRRKIFFTIPQREISPGDILATMWEASRLHKPQVDNCNRAAGIIVPCEAVADWFRKSGVTSPIRIVPLGIDTEIFRRIDDERSDKFVIGAGARLSHGGLRKGIDDVVTAFQLAFPVQNDVELRIKLWKDCDFSCPDDPRIVVDRRSLSEYEVAEWLRDCSVFCSASRGEGWGFWSQQSLAVGRPIIAPLWGGTTAFANSSCCYPVDYDLAPVPDGLPHYGGCGASWSVPRLDSLVEQMRTAYGDRRERIRKGKAGAKIAKQYSWERAGKELRKVLQEFGFVATEMRDCGCGGNKMSASKRAAMEQAKREAVKRAIQHQQARKGK